MRQEQTNITQRLVKENLELTKQLHAEVKKIKRYIALPSVSAERGKTPIQAIWRRLRWMATHYLHTISCPRIDIYQGDLAQLID